MADFKINWYLVVYVVDIIIIQIYIISKPLQKNKLIILVIYLLIFNHKKFNAH